MVLKKQNLLIAGFLLLGFQGKAQLTIQSGATFTMQAGATVTVQGNVDNAGSITNDGNLKVQGNYVNTGTYAGVGTAGVLELYGTGNSDVNAGASAIANLLINKTGATDVVKLLASATVNNSFSLTNGIFTTDPINNPSFNLISPVGAAYSFAAGKEVIGSVKRTGFTANVAHIFNQPNMLVTTTGGTNPTDFTVTMIPLSAGGDPTQAEREVKRKFNFAQTGGSGFTADIRYPYLTAELNTNTEANLVPWRLAASEWNARLTPVTRDVSNDFVTTTGIPSADLTQEWKLADPNYAMNLTAYLRGAWVNASGIMRNTLNTSSLIPLSQPYNVAPFNYTGTEAVASIPNANVVDWVLVEMRKPASGLPADAVIGTLTGRKAGFILTTGTIVDLDGVTPLSLPISKQGTGNFIVVKHRNHISAMSLSKSTNATGDFANNYSVFAEVYQKPGSPSTPVALLATSGIGSTMYGFWQGDANANGAVTSTDVTLVNNIFLGPLAGNTNVYSTRDVNLDRNVTSTDLTQTNNSFLGQATTSSSLRATTATSSPKPAVSHVPGENN